jgi:antitoxin component YwqK of YwqJK toxin-antitoxin module
MFYVCRILKIHIKVTAENFKEVQASIVKQAKTDNACSDQLQRAIDAQTWDELKDFIIDNIDWCIDNDIRLLDGYYKNNEREFTVVNRKLNGEYVSYYENGQVEQKCNYFDGLKHGEYVLYWSNGNVWTKCTYVHGKLHGEYTSYHYKSNGQVEQKCTYDNGKLHGEYVSYYDNGNVLIKCNYVNGKEHGEYVSYRKDGTVNVKCNYVNGQRVEPVC